MTARAKPSLRVLVVDDDPDVARAVTKMLGFVGHRAEAVFRAEDALQLFEPGKFDLVITDYAMPGMKGDSLAAAIRARAPAQRIVILTGFGEVFEASGAPDAADFVVHKPFNTPEFLAAIGRLFETGG